MVVGDLHQEPVEHVRWGFVGQYLSLEYLIKQASISARPHAFGLFGERLGDPNIDAQALFQFVGMLKCPFPWGFELTCVGELIAPPA
jgi:hypothetical protein